MDSQADILMMNLKEWWRVLWEVNFYYTSTIFYYDFGDLLVQP